MGTGQANRIRAPQLKAQQIWATAVDRQREKNYPPQSILIIFFSLKEDREIIISARMAITCINVLKVMSNIEKNEFKTTNFLTYFKFSKQTQA